MVAEKKETKQKIDFNQPILDEDDQPIMAPKTGGRKDESKLLSFGAPQFDKLMQHLDMKTPEEVLLWLTTDTGIDAKEIETEPVTLGSLVTNVCKGRAQVGTAAEEEKRDPKELKAESKHRARIVRALRGEKSKAQEGEFAIIALKAETVLLIQGLLWASQLDHVVYHQADEMIGGHSGLSEDESDDEEI